jgi:hypothetical protein
MLDVNVPFFSAILFPLCLQADLITRTKSNGGKTKEASNQSLLENRREIRWQSHHPHN